MDMKDIGKTLKKIPWWGYAGGGGVVLALAYFIRKDMGSKSSTSGTTSSTTITSSSPDEGLHMSDLAGMPYETYDPGYDSGSYNQYNPSGYDPDHYPPSGSPEPEPVMPNPPSPGNPIRKRPGMPGPGGPGGPTPHNPTDPTSGGTGPTPHNPTDPTNGGTKPPNGLSGQTYWHEVHAWPAWDSTLSGISGHYGMSWQQLYNYGNDKSIIDNTAHQHGHYSEEYNWLFPGEELQDAEGAVTGTATVSMEASTTPAITAPVNSMATGALSATFAASSSDQPVKASAGFLARLTVTSSGSAATAIYDNASGHTGTILFEVPASPALGTIYLVDEEALNGITIAGAANTSGLTVDYD